jgi:hypothetical protein
MLGSGLLGAVITGKPPQMMEWLAAAWVYSVTCVEKKTLELLAIKLTKRTLEIPLPGTPTVGFVLRLSPLGVCSGSRLVGEGDRRAKNLMVTQRRKGFRQFQAAKSVTPYVLCSGLY